MQFLLFKPQLLTVLIPILFCQATDGYSPWSQYGYHQVKTSDAEGVLDNGRASMQVADCLKDFYPLHSIYTYFTKTLPQMYEHLGVYHLETIGDTPNQNKIIAVRITGAKHNDEVQQRIYIQCLIHGREWAAGTACMCYTRIILNNYEKMTNGGKVKNKYFERFQAVEFIIVPVVNPDGYEFTWTDGPISSSQAKRLMPRLWRANCRPKCNKKNPEKSSGVDLNRNYDIYKDIAKKSYDRKLRLYKEYQDTGDRDKYLQLVLDSNPGLPIKNPEMETVALIKFIRKIHPITGMVDIHTAAQSVLYPEIKNRKDNHYIEEVAKKVAEAMSEFGETFEPKKIAIPKGSGIGGSLLQWATSKQHGSKKQNPRIWCIAMELRTHISKKDIKRFVPPKEKLPDMLGDAARGLQAFIREVLDWPEYQ